MVDQTGGLWLAVGVEVEPLEFVGAVGDRLPKPIPVDVLGGNRGEDLVLLGLVGLHLLDLFEEFEPALLPEVVALEGGGQVPAMDDLVWDLPLGNVRKLALLDLLQGADVFFAGFAHS